MSNPAQEELNEVTALYDALKVAGTPLRSYLENQMAKGIEKLIKADDEQLRGHIQCLQMLLELPASLQQRATHLMQDLS